MDTIAIYLRSIRGVEFFDKKTEHRLFRDARNGDRSAYDRLCKSMLHMAHNLAKQFRGRGIDLEDLIQAANLGVIRAVDGFKPELGLRLSTYAHRAVLSAILIEIARNRCAIKMPTQASEKNKALINEIVGSILSLERHMAEIPLGRLTHPLGRIIDSLPDREGSDAEHNADAAKIKVAELTRDLPERQQQIIAARLAGKTLNQIGSQLGITRERVRQIEAKAIERMRRAVA